MSQLNVSPGRPLQGNAAVPGDKSLSHRAALFTALAEGESRIENLLVAGVTEAMLQNLTALGIAWQLDDTTLTLQGRGLDGLAKPSCPLDCGSSATTLRLLAGAMAAAGVGGTLDGSSGLRSRPMVRLVEPLQAMGVSISAQRNGGAPLHLAAQPAGQSLKALEWKLPVASAQIKTALLLAGLAADGPVVLHEPGPSRDHTERMLQAMGVDLDWQPGANYPSVKLIPNPGRPLQPLQMTLPGDFSAAAFLIVAAVVTPGSHVTLEQVGLNPTRTGLLDSLQEMGADLKTEVTGHAGGEPVGCIEVRYSPNLEAVEIVGGRIVRMIDEFPVFAVAAACAAGTTRVHDAQELRYKESDRIGALCRELGRLGIDAHETEDGFQVSGGEIAGGCGVESHGDHRLAMAFSVAGLCARRAITVGGAEMIAQSFPDFVSQLNALGASVEESQDD